MERKKEHFFEWDELSIDKVVEEISKELKHKILKENSVKDYEGKIIKKLDGLISSSKVK